MRRLELFVHVIYAQALRTDFPRVALPSNYGLLRGLVELGRSLVSLHLLETSPKSAVPKWTGDRDAPVQDIGFGDNTIWTDKKQKAGFRSVSAEVWEFRVGGYQVCAKWLKDRRGRALTSDEIEQYQRVVAAIRETLGITSDIDDLIAEHGGWPGAFQASSASYSVQLPPLRRVAESDT